ncbi:MULTISPECIES: multidrug efflux MFS transporter MdtH [Aeromonas]|nr:MULTISPECIES: multidrug efflux MFS transporter MdtH [Aeromonas]MBL0590607.1 multidrug efflux MFS transporter MdtH [Aeromonas veronii]MBL0640395.1 multidrug efflux MFS transporter MdtH [Aeromonas veronii]QHC06868.1 multidrug efflux MFS transporter MdtH [Aeromonas veronii]QWZ75925.1 multidrug efflux MFS transporter MdtH [Aeromonas sp. FDAARGOS 1419]RUR55998.1 multidrug efflux MFS transporter MdtH [Aeromonas veronii]
MVDRARFWGRWFLALDTTLVILGFFVVMPMISLRFVDQLGWAAGLVGLALGLRQLTQQGLGIFGGSLADRFGARPLIVTGMLLRAVGFATLAWADSGAMLIFSCFLSGLGGCLFDPPRAALVIKFTRPHERGRFISLLMMLESAGAVTGALLGSWLLRFDFTYVCLLGAGLFTLAALCNWTLLPAYRLSVKPTPMREGLGQVLADRAFCRLVLILSGYYMLWVQVMLIFPILVKQLSGTTTAVGWMYSLETALSLALLYPIARFSERRYRLESRLMAGILLMTVGIGLVAFVSTLSGIFVLLACFYLGIIICEPARETLMTRLANPTARGSYMGFSRLGLALGGMTGYVGGGSLYDFSLQQGQPALPWLVLGTIGVATMLLLARCFSRRPELAIRAA